MVVTYLGFLLLAVHITTPVTSLLNEKFIQYVVVAVVSKISITLDVV